MPEPKEIPDDVRLWIAKVRERLEHNWRNPITISDSLRLLRESVDLAQRHNCYNKPRLTPLKTINPERTQKHYDLDDLLDDCAKDKIKYLLEHNLGDFDDYAKDKISS